MSRTGAVYHYATPFDVFLVVTGCLLKFGFGVMQGFMLVIFSEFFDTGIDEFEEMSLFMLKWLCILGGISFFLEGGGTAFIDLSKNRQIAEWKKGYIKGVLRQEVAWYDVNKPQELSTRMGEALVQIEAGLGVGTMGLICPGGGQAQTPRPPRHWAKLCR